MAEPTFQIGTLSRLTGASPKAIRLYEELGLLPVLQRRGRYRMYGQLHADAVALIRCAMGLGFKLRELQALAQDAGFLDGMGAERIRQLVRGKYMEIEVQMAALLAQRAELSAFEAQLNQVHEVACRHAQDQKRADPAMAKRVMTRKLVRSRS